MVYARAMKLKMRTVAAVLAASIGFAGCGDSADNKASAVTDASASAAAPYSWSQFRNDYPGLKSECDDLLDGEFKMGCYRMHNAYVKSAKISAQDLPAGKPRSDLLAAFESYEEAMRKFDAANCDSSDLSPGGKSVACIGAVGVLQLTDMSMVGIIKRNSP